MDPGNSSQNTGRTNGNLHARMTYLARETENGSRNALERVISHFGAPVG